MSRSTDPVAIGIDVGGTKLVAATVAADGTVQQRLRRETPARDESRLVQVLRELITDLGPDLPVGIGIAGLVTRDGTVRYGPNINVHDLALAEALAGTAKEPVVVVNDASAAVVGEQRVGAAQGRSDVVLLTLGTGVGGGIIINGALVTGAHGYAGELGHIVVEEGGRPCPCGNRGCVEAYASGTALGLMARERLVDWSVRSSLREVPELTGKAVTAAALAGDALAQDILHEAGRWLGVAMAGVVNALDPEVVLLGGGAAPQTARWIVPSATGTMVPRLIGHAHRTPPPVELTVLGDDAGMIGAALLAAAEQGVG